MNLENLPQRKKTLTRFICQELLYEFVTGRLDQDRQAAVDEYLSECRDSQRELDRLKRGLRYTSQATHLQVREDLRRSLVEFEPHWKKVLTTWTLQSSQRGWRLLPYIFLVLALILGLFVVKPWSMSSRSDVLLVEQAKVEPELIAPPTDAKVESIPATPMVEVPDEVPTQVAEVAAVTGSVRRGSLEVVDFENAWPAIRDKIQALGGKVVGNIGLGRQRKPGEAYFQFSIPEANQPELELFLKTFGEVRFRDEPTPRVMPEGQIRIILTVKDGGTDESSSETP